MSLMTLMSPPPTRSLRVAEYAAGGVARRGQKILNKPTMNRARTMDFYTTAASPDPIPVVTPSSSRALTFRPTLPTLRP